MSRIYNELSTLTITVEPFTLERIAYKPQSARYRVDDCLSGDELVPWTTITPLSTSMPITIPGSVNAIINNRLRNPEKKVLTVNTDNGLATQHFDEYEYRIRNLSFIPPT